MRTLAVLAALAAASPAGAGEARFAALAPLVFAGEEGVVGADGTSVTEGSLTGPLLAEPDLAEVGSIRCTARLVVDSVSLAESASGTCRVEGPAPGDAFTGTFACEGVFSAGCLGSFTVTGGTGAHAGATGGGAFSVKAVHSSAAVAAGGRLITVIHAAATWPELAIATPD